LSESVTIFPVPNSLIDRFFEDRKNVFVKYHGHATAPHLEKGSRIAFYASQNQRELVGEGLVQSVEFLTPEETLAKYGNQLFLSKEELIAYGNSRPRNPSRKMLVLVLEHLTKYKRRITYPKRMTMAGARLTLGEYKSIMETV